MAKTKRSSSKLKKEKDPGAVPGSASKAEKKKESIGGINKKGKRKERKQKFLQRLKEAQDHLALGASNEEVLASVRQIGSALPDLKTRAAAPKRSKPLTNKMRQKLFVSEVSQFANVLQHPSFNDDPLSAIRVHLENTIDTAPLAEEVEADSDEDTSGPIRSRLDKKKGKREGKRSAADGPGGVKVPIGKQKAIKRSQEKKRKEIEERGKPVSAREARRRGAKELSTKLGKKMIGMKRAKSTGLVKAKAKKKVVKF